MPRFKNENHSVEKACPICNGTFKTFLSLNRIYCSFKCYHQGGKKHCKPKNTVVKKCDFCGAEVSRPESNFHSDKVFCNYSCMAQWQSINKRREHHPRWAGGTRNARGCGWKSARLEAIKRAGAKCKMCRRKTRGVHHKIPVRCFKTASDAHQQSNLIVLCQKCHPKMEKIFRDSMPLLNLIQWKNQDTPA